MCYFAHWSRLLSYLVAPKGAVLVNYSRFKPWVSSRSSWVEAQPEC